MNTRIAGIPCQIQITNFERVRGSYNAPSSLDYSGYTECTWHVLDRNGRKANWLERKLTEADRDRIEREIAAWSNA